MQSTDIIQPLPLISPIATDGLKNSIPDAATGTNNASIEEGFPQITMKAPANGGLPPFGQDFNGLFYTISSLNCFLQNGGYITFNQSVSDKIGGYPSGAILDYIDSTGTYSKVQSLIDNNTNNFVTTPSFIDGVNWKQLEVSPSAFATLANVDLSNLSEAGKKVFDGQWVSKQQELTSITSGSVEVDLSEYLPEDEYNYEVMMTYSAWNINSNMQVTTTITSSVITTAGAYSYTSQGARASGQYTIAVGADRKINVLVGGDSYTAGGHGIYAIAYRRLGTNE